MWPELNENLSGRSNDELVTKQADGDKWMDVSLILEVRVVKLLSQEACMQKWGQGSGPDSAKR